MSLTFGRNQLAADMARQILRPGPLERTVQSGLFIFGQLRAGKTTFLKVDLIPELEKEGAIVIYVDLRVQPQMNPAQVAVTQIRKTLWDLSTPHSSLLARLRTLHRRESYPGVFKFGFEVGRLGEPDGTTLAQAITELVDQVGTDIVLIVDEVQHALESSQGKDLLFALKATREAVNIRADPPGRFIVVGVGSHRDQVQELVAGANQAFLGAAFRDYPMLGEEYQASEAPWLPAPRREGRDLAH